MKIYIRCFACGKVHKLLVIPLLSNYRKGKYIVFCRNKYKFYTLYSEAINSKAK